MNPECLLIAAPSINFGAFTSVCETVLGYSPSQSANVTQRELSEAELFLSCLAALRDPHAPVGFAANLLTHVAFSVFIVAHEHDFVPILERCSGMAFVSAETLVSGVMAAVVSGTLAQWRDAVAAGCTPGVRPTVRAGFNKIYDIFCGANLDVWGSYRQNTSADGTLLLEYKPR